VAWRPWKASGSSEFDDAAQSSGEPSTEVINTVADLLEVFGRNGFDTKTQSQEELERLCKLWSRHVRNGEPVPGSEDAAASEAERRSWQGVIRFIDIQREQERIHVGQLRDQVNTTTEGLDELKRTLRDFAQNLRYAVGEDEKSDLEVVGELDALHTLALSSETDMNSLRVKVTETVKFVQASIETRQHRHAKQVEQLGRELVAVKAELATASSEAQRDGLTDLFNRKALDEQLDRMVSLCQMTGRPTCVVMVDLDTFKEINDVYGHQAGDQALQALSKVLATVVLRKSDFVARYGGDEFTVILNNCRLSAARFIADRLLSAIRNIEINSDAGSFGITASMGIAELSSRESREDWVKRADLNLLSAKRAGRDRVH
jgi:diguanylate cyclase